METRVLSHLHKASTWERQLGGITPTFRHRIPIDYRFVVSHKLPSASTKDWIGSFLTVTIVPSQCDVASLIFDIVAGTVFARVGSGFAVATRLDEEVDAPGADGILSGFQGRSS